MTAPCLLACSIWPLRLLLGLPFSRRSCGRLGWPDQGWVAIVVVVLGWVSIGPAWGQVQTAQLQGRVFAVETGRPLSGVKVVLRGPALAKLQTEVTDAAGHYLITQLPPAENYQVRFYYGDIENPCAIQTDLQLRQGQTLPLNARIGKDCGKDSVKVIRESSPNIDIASPAIGGEIDQELMTYAPVRGRTFESLLALAPGAADVAPRSLTNNLFGVIGGDAGVSIAGATGTENNYIIDGLNATDPYLGVVGTELSQYFIRNINIQVGGYQAEYGRATGGVISILTKSGTNDIHGGVYGSVQPFQLAPLGVARLGESVVTRTLNNGAAFDLGADVGGAIVRDRIFYYVGLAVTASTTRIERRGRRLSAGPSGDPMLLADYTCPSYLTSPTFCVGARALALHTDELSYGQQLEYVKRVYNGIAKLQIAISPNHNLTLSYIGSPTTLDGYTDTLSVDLDSNKYSEERQLHDVTAHYLGKLLGHKLQLDGFYGFHYQGDFFSPQEPAVARINYLADPKSPYSLADFENVPVCRRYQAGAKSDFNPCPVTNYSIGLGPYTVQTLHRHQALASATYLFQALGLHAIKFGFDFEDIRNDQSIMATGPDVKPDDPSSGHRLYQTDPSGSQIFIRAEYAHSGPNGEVLAVNQLRSILENRNYSLYLRDGWSVSFAPGLQLNLGVRWEAQELYGADNQLGVGIYDNWSPRLGIVYDFTQSTGRSGRGKLFFNYGRMYESLPIYANSNTFVPVGVAVSNLSSTCPKKSFQPGGLAVPVPDGACKFNSTVYGDYAFSAAPSLQGQYINELELGIIYDVGYNIVVGLYYIHRDLGTVIDFVSVDDNYYMLGNPGAPAGVARVKELQAEVEQSGRIAANPGASSAQKTAYENARSRLAAYQGAATLFARPRRDYNAIVLTVNKQLSHRFSVNASYTYSRTLGNYPGTYSSYNGLLSPNGDFQFVHLDTLTNRSGPLPNDRPHNLKVVGLYAQPLGHSGTLTVGLTLSIYSGRPIDVLGSRSGYGGEREVFILPRGAGGRTPTVSQLDFRCSYEHRLGSRLRLGLSIEVINLFDLRQVTNVDDQYTTSFVAPIKDGQPEDLRHLRAVNGNVVPNSNYGQPTAYQEPLYLRIGGRLTF